MDKLEELYEWAEEPTYPRLRQAVPSLKRPEALFGGGRVFKPSHDLVINGVRACLLVSGRLSEDFVEQQVTLWDEARQRAARRNKGDIRVEAATGIVVPVILGALINFATEYQTSILLWTVVIIATVAAILVIHKFRTGRFFRSRPGMAWAGLTAGTAIVLIGGAVADALLAPPAAPTAGGDMGPQVRAWVIGASRETALQGWDWVFPNKKAFTAAEQREIIERTSDIPAMSSWMQEHGGVDPLLQRVSVMVVGNARAGAVITGMSLRTRCGPPLTGTIVRHPPGGGPVDNPRLVFDLDVLNPRAQGYVAAGRRGEDYFTGKSINLAYGEQVVVSMEARSRRRSCTYDIVIESNSARGEQSQVVETKGARLAVTAYADGAVSSSAVKDLGAYSAVYELDDAGALTLTR
ncbi:hypothetical protein [Nonomuraea sediminis]|uniref:hypothetical protein n=1 Tax=Nonomuraea sediminis TaxID=2835864 RepID=UPI001BDDBAD2|nr:hypothetical protein [Nonomuraea sediminis]